MDKDFNRGGASFLFSGSLTGKLTLGGLLVALDIIAARFLGVYTPGYLVRISPQFLAHALAGWILGPVWAALTAAAGDVLGMLINPAGLSYYPGYTLSAVLNGLLYGQFLYRKPVTWHRCALAVATPVLLISTGLGTVWNAHLMGKGFWGSLLLALPWRLATIPAYACVLYLIQKRLKTHLV